MKVSGFFLYRISKFYCIMSSHISLKPLVKQDYQIEINNNAFFNVNINLICKHLKNHSCWHGSQDIIKLHPNSNTIISNDFLLPLLNDKLSCINKCIVFHESLKTASKSTCDNSMKSRHKLLVQKEKDLLLSFIGSRYHQFFHQIP